MNDNAKKPRNGEYALASGAAAVRRLYVLHNIYGPAGRRILLQAGLKPGMHVADFGCGVGAVTRMLGEIVGPSAASPELTRAFSRSTGLPKLSNAGLPTSRSGCDGAPPACHVLTSCTAASCFFIYPTRRLPRDAQGSEAWRHPGD
jgi:hypothetical protein